MPIQENALNAALAEVLSDHGVHATPEQTRANTGLERCDVQIRRQHGDRDFCAVECKINQNSSQKTAAVKDAQRWLKQPDCWNAIALCYPREISMDNQNRTLRQLIEASSDLLMVRVSRAGMIGQWKLGQVNDLVRLASDVGANHNTCAVTDILYQAIISASAQINESTGKDLAEALELPWSPKNSRGDPRPARIACLILANMALLQNRMHSQNVRIPKLDSQLVVRDDPEFPAQPIPIANLEPLLVVRDAPSRQTALLDNWQKIRAVDYAPVVDPAILILQTLPSDSHTDNLLKILIEAVLECAPLIRGLQLDHAGPLYHGLLQTARYDGSFYTSTAAAVLLAELAVPSDWHAGVVDWSNANSLAKLKICDPACGTGTLLMAVARTIEERFRSSGGSKEDLELLHLSLIEDVLHGFDINRHAIHLAASMLTLSAPKIDYNKMNLYNMQHGVNTKGEVRAGSLDLLVGDARYLPTVAPEMSQRRTSASGYRDEVPNIEGLCDLVIMNPPFTRNDIRNRSLPDADRREVQNHEKSLAAKVSDPIRREAINQTTAFSFFTPVADLLVNRTGTVAIVQPFTSCTGPAAKGHRNILTDPERFHLELVVTSHDNRRIHFSENTSIHESLVIARRPSSETQAKPTAFVSLSENPTSASEAHALAEAIRLALDGDRTQLANYGTIAWRSFEQIRNRPWNAAAFYIQSLVDDFDVLLTNQVLTPLGQIAKLTDGRGVRGAFVKAKKRQNPDMQALWDHKTSRQTTMRTQPDHFIVAKRGKEKSAGRLWQKQSHLLLANRMRLNTVQTPAVFSDKPILGSAFVLVSPVHKDSYHLCKAWCVWMNSTFGILSFLNIRQKDLSYPSFSMEALRSLPVPHPEKCDITSLTQAFDYCANSPLKPLPDIHIDQLRHALDNAVVAAVPNLPAEKLPELRQTIADEPTVNNKKEE